MFLELLYFLSNFASILILIVAYQSAFNPLFDKLHAGSITSFQDIEPNLLRAVETPLI